MNWDYIAGFTDGEGYIGWNEGRTKDQSGRGAKIIIGQKSKLPLEQIQIFLLENGCRKVKLYLRPAREKSINAKANATECWILLIQNCYDVKIFLDAVNDRLILKRDKALFILSKLNSCKRVRTKFNDNNIVNLIKQGLTSRQIAKQLNIGFKHIGTVRKQNNITEKYCLRKKHRKIA